MRDRTVRGTERTVTDQRRASGKLVCPESIRVTSRDSSMLISGKIPGIARASSVFPAPGDPTRSMLWTKDRSLFSSHCVDLIIYQGRVDVWLSRIPIEPIWAGVYTIGQIFVLHTKTTSTFEGTSRFYSDGHLTTCRYC